MYDFEMCIHEIVANKNLKRFVDDLGFISYYKLVPEEMYEFEEKESVFWDKAKTWIALNLIKVKQQKKGNGKVLLQKWLDKLPKGIGIVLNATPVDTDMTQQKLQNWYVAQGFKQISPDNISLYKIL